MAIDKHIESAAAAHPALDFELIALGEQIEPLIVEHFEAICEWAPLATEVSWKMKDEYNEVIVSPDDPKRAAFAAASERMSVTEQAIESLVERIIELPATTLAGLRAKALVALFEARPWSASGLDNWHFPESDGGEWRSLFDAAANLTGLAPMVREFEAKFDKIAAEIEAAEHAQARTADDGTGEVEEARGDVDHA